MAVGKAIGGRRKATQNRDTAGREKEIAKGGDTSLDYMLKLI
ncbi:hypothetical protein FHS67_001932 [Aminobacter aminovorans]|jgi:hypothetical protein|uniref:Uncharacterized protein n=1 Tax=Aminobacter aminovorans TaxID=83263 RepID=A0AAC9FEA3_AMIAI|nr:hypothetical protein AA2016_5085 [Aminobacter aminovorans]MBB3705617.1 hypothetical protein [Aminobacter aminovorans]